MRRSFADISPERAHAGSCAHSSHAITRTENMRSIAVQSSCAEFVIAVLVRQTHLARFENIRPRFGLGIAVRPESQSQSSRGGLACCRCPVVASPAVEISGLSHTARVPRAERDVLPTITGTHFDARRLSSAFEVACS